MEGATLYSSVLGETTRASFRFVDLFAGIGGFRVGFEAIGGKCVFTSELDKFARMTYEANFSLEHPIAGDIRDVEISRIPDHEVLLAGFPCQPFSLAGVSKKTALGRPHGFEDETQGTLFFNIARIIDSRKPDVFLLENVKNLKNHDGGQTFRIILQTLGDELGYYVQHRVIDAARWVPQHRERTFILGFKEDVDFNFDAMPIPEGPGPKLCSILHPGDGRELPEPPFTLTESSAVNSKYTLSANLWQYLQEYAQRHRARGNGFGFGLVGPENIARTMSARYHKDGAEILIRQNGSPPRRLTPREAARLMGFRHCPANPEQPWKIPVSDAQAYRQFGNAVVPAVVEHIARHIREFIPEPSNTGLQEVQSPLRLVGDSAAAGA
jgi:DNA (cytosine-5)-methyltransferase 1